jgi:hypothetical protein
LEEIYRLCLRNIQKFDDNGPVAEAIFAKKARCKRTATQWRTQNVAIWQYIPGRLRAPRCLTGIHVAKS